ISTKQTGDNNIKSIENQRDDELRQLQEHIVILTTQYAQLDEANRAWQQFQQTQLDNFRNKFQHILFIDNHLSLDQISINMNLLIFHNLVSVQSASSSIDKNDEELYQLRENILTLSNKYVELDEANHAWQLF
ncbi:unnamed protein product, partial [Rotaria sp. Silwood2]